MDVDEERCDWSPGVRQLLRGLRAQKQRVDCRRDEIHPGAAPDRKRRQVRGSQEQGFQVQPVLRFNYFKQY